MDQIWDQVYFNNTVRAWAISLGIIFGSMILLRLVQSVVVNRIKKLSEKTKTTIDDFIIRLIQRAIMPLLYVVAIFFGLKYLRLPEQATNIIRVAAMLVVTFFIIRMVTSFIAYVFQRTVSRRDKNPERERQAKGILLIIQLAVWLIGLLFLIDNLGYDITTLVAGLGIGGIAIALAAQTVLGDLFSYLVIFFDKPFEIGDFIIVQDKLGTVEYIGIKTTRIRTLGGEQLICSNTDLTNSRVHNYKRMLERRIVFTFGVVYNTPSDKLRQIPEMVKNIVLEAGDTRFDRAHFKAFGNFSLDFEVVYFVLSPDFNFYMDKQQYINLAIFELFEKENIEFAFPTQTLHVQRIQSDSNEVQEN